MARELVLALAAIALFVPGTIHKQVASTPNDKSETSTEARKIANPVKPTPQSIALGKKYYAYDCAMCHGELGDGKGEVAVDEKYTLPDFTDPNALKDKTDGELFYSLKNGKGHMPLERVRVTPDELWNLINYVRSMAKK